MKLRIVSVLMSVFIILMQCKFVDAEEVKYTFRQTTWGMNVDQVKKSENAEPEYDKQDGVRHALSYTENIAGLDCNVVYLFVYDKLVRAKYVIAEEHSNKSDYLSDFDTLHESLTKKYGKASSDDVYWKNDLYKDNYQEWGMAVAVGHLAKFSKWEVQGTTIIEYISGDNFDISLGIEYSSKDLHSLEEKATTDAEQNKF